MIKKSISLILIIATLLTVLCSCSGRGSIGDPAAWGYDCYVTYNGLGGMIGAREIRITNYLKDSYVYEPSGSDGMLVKPRRENYELSGWYTACTDTGEKDIYGYTVYEFKPEDRWDFQIDRVHGDLTLYARWVPTAKAHYYDASTGEELFNRNITATSPMQALSTSVENLVTSSKADFEADKDDSEKKKDFTLIGYYNDKECTEVCDFTQFKYSELLPDDAAVYEMLLAEFPEVLGVYEGEEKPAEESVAVKSEESDDGEIKADVLTDTSDKFLHDMGYCYLTDDKAQIEALNLRKKQIYEEYIDEYEKNSVGNRVYLRFVEGKLLRVTSMDKLKSGSTYSFSLSSDYTGMILLCDLDFAGKKVSAPTGEYGGYFYGNGYTVSNVTISEVIAKGQIEDETKSIALFGACKDVIFTDATFKNIKVSLAAGKNDVKNPAYNGNSTAVGIIAGTAENLTFTNCSFSGCSVSAGSESKPIILSEGRQVYVGDIAGNASVKPVLNDCDVNITTAAFGDYAVITTDAQ